MEFSLILAEQVLVMFLLLLAGGVFATILFVVGIMLF